MKVIIMAVGIGILSGCSFLLCGDRGVEHTGFLWTNVKCHGDVKCEGKWVHPHYCKDGKLTED